MNSIPEYNTSKELLTTAEKVGQLFMPAAFINDTEVEICQIEKLIQQHHIGSLCFFHSRLSAATNFEGKKEVIHNERSFETLIKLINRYQKAAKYPLLMAIDAEWGLAMRIENTPQYPYAITLGAIEKNENLIFQVGAAIAQDCKTAGIHWNLSPVVDLNNNPNNPVIGYRSFGENRQKVTTKALAYVKGTQSQGILTSIKHFPGHGDTATDSHLGLPLIAKTKEELIINELYPFQKLIDEGVNTVMVGHLSVPALAKGEKISSSLSKDIIKGILREEMGFTGVVISDALNMHAVSKNYPAKGELEWLAFDAGNDVLCFAEHIPEGIYTILKHATSEQIEESFKRVWELKGKAQKSSSSLESDSKLTMNSALNKKIAEKSITLYKGTVEIIANFRKTDYCTLSLKRYPNQTSDEILKNLKITQSEIQNEENILLLLTPPNIKPAGLFGFLKEEIAFINTMIATKNVVLYLFGNPYVLNHINIKNAKSVVIIYQNFKEFQDIATAHFLGDVTAVGTLPVILNSEQK